jgi:hypothetical protein
MSRPNHVPITSMKVASDVPESERTRIEVLRTDSATFRSVLAQRRDRQEPWFKYNPGVIDLCNVPLPVRTPGGHLDKTCRADPGHFSPKRYFKSIPAVRG